MKKRSLVVSFLIVAFLITLVSGCHKPTDPDGPVDVEVTDETVIIDPDQTTISQVTPNQVIVSGTADYQCGDVIVSEVSTAAPSGILRKVQSVTVQGNQTILNTIPATLEDVFDNADILVNQALSTKDIKESRVLTNGVFFVPDTKNDEKFSYDINKQITLPTGQVMNITGELGAENSFDFDLKIRNKNISFLKYTHIAEQSAELAVSVNNSYNYSNDFDLYEHTFYPFTVWIGPVPLVFVPKIKVVLNVSASGEAGVSTSITQTASVSAGLQLQDGQWSTSSDEDVSFDFQPPQLTNELSVSVGAGPDLSLMLFGIAGPYANTRGSLVLTADLMSTPWWTLTGKVKIDGGIMFDALGVEADYSSNFLNYSHVIAQATQNQCATPLFNPPAGTYTNTQSVSISCATPNAIIKYTTNGSDPNSSSPVYSTPISVSQNTTLKAKATKSGWTDSSVATAEYTISPIQTVATPTFNPAGGTYQTAQNVTISCSTPGATIFYSTDGSTPSIQYTGPVNISTTTTMKAKATKSGWNDSSIASATYTISILPTVATPTFSLPSGSYNTNPLSITISCSTSSVTIRYTTNGDEPTSTSTPYSGAIELTQTTTLKAKAFKTGWSPSDTATAIYTILIYEVGYYDTPGSANGVTAVGNYAYVCDGSSGLQIINISNPSSPILTSYYDTPGSAMSVTIVGNYAYIADYYSGLLIVNISNPSSPSFIGSCDTPGFASSVAISGDYAFVTDRSSPGGIQIINISNPSSPSIAHSYSMGSRPTGISISGNYAYVSTNGSGLRILDISNPISPSSVSSGDGYFWGIDLVDNYVYVADGSYGIRKIDISNPASPQEVSVFDTPGDAYHVRIYGNYAYVADRSAGMTIIDITQPPLNSFIGNYNTTSSAYEVKVLGNYAYIADANDGLRIIYIGNLNNK